MAHCDLSENTYTHFPQNNGNGVTPINGTLYLVATPIGNLEDITLRALRLLGSASLVAAEDTRTARNLLRRHGIRQRIISYNEHNMKLRTPQLLAALREGDVALVSEAGTPGISDPGYELVVAAVEAGFNVSPVPGPSAVVSALAASGLPSREFTFAGFLPRRSAERRRLFASLAREQRTLVAFESPHRVQQSLADIAATLGERRLAVCRELTKVFEEIFRGTAEQALAHFAEPRGEFTLVIEGAPPGAGEPSEEDARQSLRRLRDEGLSGRDAVARVTAELGIARKAVYRLWLDVADEA